MNIENIILSDEQLEILKKLDSPRKKIIFLTGRAGTGKSTLISFFRDRYNKNLVVLAPTGVAALNVGGLTIHRFFRFGKNISEDRFCEIDKNDDVYKKLDCLIIDEISMVRADILDFVDRFLREAKRKDIPFGGVKMIFVGDLYQLPPVFDNREREFFRDRYESEFFFSSDVFNNANYEIYELTNIYRQGDLEFIEILNAVRNDVITKQLLDKLNNRLDFISKEENKELFITLCSLRKVARKINSDRLEELSGQEEVFQSAIIGAIKPEDYPAREFLKLKVDSQVMFLNNDPDGRWKNGTLGKILGFDHSLTYENKNEPIVRVQLRSGKIVNVERHQWDIEIPKYDKEKKRISINVIGEFVQYPLMLAWAVSIHKSQGKTFDNVILDISGGLFAPGQLYVGLSRCRTLNGITLRQEITEKHIRVDWRVSKYFKEYYIEKAEQIMSFEAKEKLIKSCVEKKQKMYIKYLNKKGIFSTRYIIPLRYYEQEFKGNYFMGLDAFDFKREMERTFQIKRIINILNLDELISYNT